MMLRSLQLSLKAYSGIYFLLSIVTPILVGFGWFVAAASEGYSSEALWEKAFAPGFTLLFQTVLFFAWWRIFRKLLCWIEQKNIKDIVEKKLLLRTSQLLLFAFSIELLSEVLDEKVFYTGPDDWSSIHFPSGDVQWPLRAWHLCQWLLKLSAQGGFFVTPRTTGLATLFLAGFFYLFSRRREGSV